MTGKVLPVLPYSWQQSQWQQLQKLIENERLPHALLLSGCSDIGKLRFARALAQQLLCEAPIHAGACGRCKQCALVMAGSHPDLIRLEPEGAGNAIKIAQIRTVGNFMAKTAQQGGWKVVLIEPAEAMNVSSANALLKNLEEPGDKTLLILVSHQLGRIPATVRSRCRILKFPLPSQDFVTSWLRQVVGDAEDISQLLQVSGGRPLKALRLVESDALTKRKEFESLLNDVASGTLSPIKAADWCRAEDSIETVEWLQFNVAERVRQKPATREGRLLFRFLDKLNVAKQRLQSSANPNPQLLWEELLLDWQALFAASR
ncbi:MAG: DNA polymerase III subunit delta' [Pseudomonadales bacterium]|nr:DNA polymerase III subunit delta' [Pseudomonadales bacterium]MCP5171582.1 DNA polymerase III subunit delta' [Pseudomonadales bacterium]